MRDSHQIRSALRSDHASPYTSDPASPVKPGNVVESGRPSGGRPFWPRFPAGTLARLESKWAFRGAIGVVERVRWETHLIEFKQRRGLTLFLGSYVS